MPLLRIEFIFGPDFHNVPAGRQDLRRARLSLHQVFDPADRARICGGTDSGADLARASSGSRHDANFHFTFLCLRLINVDQLEDLWPSRLFCNNGFHHHSPVSDTITDGVDWLKTGIDEFSNRRFLF